MNAVEKLASKVVLIENYFSWGIRRLFGNEERMKSYVEFAMQSHMNLHFGNQKNRADNPEKN